MNVAQLLLVGAISFTVAVLAPFVLLPILRYFRVIDVPNERSSHKETTIRGAGLATLAGVAAGTVSLLLLVEPESLDMVLLTGMIVLAISLLGAVEDWRGLPIIVRAGLQLVLGCVLGAVLVADGGHQWLLIPVIALFFTAYVNIANFMDGVDGISGMHGAVVGGAYTLLAWQLELHWLATLAFIIAVAFAAFLPWNLGRGRVFMGDAGSYLLGGSIATLAVVLFVSGAPLVTVLAPLSIYLADTGITLLKRMLRGEKWYQSHREHVYQSLTDVGLSHVQVSSVVTGLTVLAAVIGSFAGFLQPMWLRWLAAALLVVTVAGYLFLPRILSTTQSVPVRSGQPLQARGRR